MHWYGFLQGSEDPLRGENNENITKEMFILLDTSQQSVDGKLVDYLACLSSVSVALSCRLSIHNVYKLVDVLQSVYLKVLGSIQRSGSVSIQV